MKDKEFIYRASLYKMIDAHRDQTNKLGESYIEHPLRVATVYLKNEDYIIKSIGLLHDVKEDCYDIDTSYFEEYKLAVDRALYLLTHDKQMSYKDYIDKIINNKIATKVKIADLLDNSDPERLDALYKKDPKTALRLAKKYKWALEFLTK